jgi:hypothetical protein
MYFEKPGKHNSEKTLEIVKNAVRERGIKYVVVATSKGHMAKLFKDADLGAKLVCVAQVYGFANPGERQVSEELEKELVNAGASVLTTTHVLSGVERGMSRKFGGVYPAEIIAHSLRMLGQGVKVCVEVATMALDAGLIPYGEDIIAVGGTHSGADTAVIMRPAHAANIFDTWISEILCKPANKA